ncbi:MAG: hypothetical protein ACON5F_02250 [Jejuia sp.]
MKQSILEQVLIYRKNRNQYSYEERQIIREALMKDIDDILNRSNSTEI